MSGEPMGRWRLPLSASVLVAWVVVTAVGKAVVTVTAGGVVTGGELAVEVGAVVEAGAGEGAGAEAVVEALFLAMVNKGWIRCWRSASWRCKKRTGAASERVDG